MQEAIVGPAHLTIKFFCLHCIECFMLLKKGLSVWYSCVDLLWYHFNITLQKYNLFFIPHIFFSKKVSFHLQVSVYLYFMTRYFFYPPSTPYLFPPKNTPATHIISHRTSPHEIHILQKTSSLVPSFYKADRKK